MKAKIASNAKRAVFVIQIVLFAVVFVMGLLFFGNLDVILKSTGCKLLGNRCVLQVELK